jgi:DNA-binding NtrC family response regulator
MEKHPGKILVVDDDPNMRKILTAFLRRDGYTATGAADGLEAKDHLARETFHTVITDQKMPRMDGLTLLSHCMQLYRQTPVIIITAHGTIETAVHAMKRGAFDYITKPFDEAELLNVIRKAVAVSSKNLHEPSGTCALASRSGIIGKAPSMKRIFKLISKVAASPSSVLVMGETGTGKELIARALHAESDRRDKPFISVNCGAIPENLVESELFGYEKGAFTGAVTSKPGRLELADGGTVFLDEVSELKETIQVKLLRALQTRTFERVGGLKTTRVDVRVIAATNCELAAEVRNGRFRSDLYYRLNVVAITVPPLRDRIEDIPDMVNCFVDRFNLKLGKKIRGVSDETLQALLSHTYPGNVRELENILERAVLLTDGKTIELSDLPAETRTSSVVETTVDLKTAAKTAVSRTEKALIVKALEDSGGNVTQAAKQLGMSRRGLQLKMKEYKLR